MSDVLSPNPNLFERVHNFVAAGADQELTEGDWADFEQLLRENGDAFDLYFHYVRESAMLQTICDTIVSEDASLVAEQPDSSRLPLLGVLGDPWRGTFSSFSVGWPAAYLIATVIMTAGLLTLAITQVSPPIHVAGTPPSDAGNPVAMLAHPPAAPIVGQITGMADCKWSVDSGHNNLKSSVALGDRLAIRSGLLEITYNSGAKVILQGPVTYEVESAAGGYLAIGKLTARLEKKENELPSPACGRGGGGEGGQNSPAVNRLSSSIHHPSFSIQHSFVVRTPMAIVTDLGTEFGVEVGEKGDTTSHVFRGKVSLTPLNRGHTERRDDVILEANQSACVKIPSDGSHSRPEVLRSSDSSARFVRSMPASIKQQVKASEAYADLVLSLHPAVYYRMEPPAPSENALRVFDSAAGGHHGLIGFDQNAFKDADYATGRFGAALRFRGPMVRDHVIVRDYPKAENDELSVSVWIMSLGRPTKYATIAANWGNISGQFNLGVLDPGYELKIEIAQRNGSVVVLGEKKEEFLAMGVWQHIAFVADGKMLRLYRNGGVVAAGPCNGVSPQPPMKSLGIGCKTNDLGTQVDGIWPSYWNGRIDELAIFNRAISVEEMQQLYQGGKKATEKKIK